MVRSLLSIWLHPRGTMRAALERDSRREMLLLAALLGVALLLVSAVDDRWGETLATGWIVLIIVAGGPPFGVFWVYLMGGLLHWTGRWLGGGASPGRIRQAVAFGGIPMLWIGALTLLLVLLFGGDAFTSARTDLGVLSWAMVIVIVLLTPVWLFLFLVAPVIIGVKCLAEVQGMTAWRALLNYLLAYSIMIGAGLAIAVVLILFTNV